MGQERDLPRGTVLTRKRYRVYRDTWEHDHCVFCSAKFMDPDFSGEHRQFIRQHPEVLTEGYATTSDHLRGVDYYWICPECFTDFAEEFEWLVVEA